MKRLVIIPLTPWAVIGAAAQNPAVSQHGGSVKTVFLHPDEVTFVEGRDSIRLTVKGLEGNPDFYYAFDTGLTASSQTNIEMHDIDLFSFDIFNRNRSKKKVERPDPYKRFYCDGLNYLMLGWANTAKDVTGLSVSPRFCSDLTINVFQWGYASYSRKKRVGWSVSASLDWSYYSLRSTDNRFVRTDDATLLQTFPVEWSSASSAFRYNTFTLPVRLHLRLDECRLYAGSALDFNFNGRIRDKYNKAGDSKKDRTPDVRLEPFSFHVEGGLRWKTFGIYCKWNPCEVLKGGASPDIQTISFGFILGHI